MVRSTPRGSCFLDPGSADFWPEWEKAANDSVAFLRTETGRSPQDKGLTDLIGELSAKSDEFVQRWARHDVKFHRSGVKQLHHPLVGDLALPYEALDLPAEPGLRITVYSPEPDSPERQTLDLLASWTDSTAAKADLEPDSGRARLSYEMAETVRFSTERPQ
ncbi:hypothetical protein GCM10009680_81220 [Streptomyces yatensis]|uniref:MmyB-like transcription regulator ligand binding domain-containing protein n=1 Tax=Streptomyces yatensis TaxID=155177 RepID=A0ABN2JID4_9ACTN